MFTYPKLNYLYILLPVLVLLFFMALRSRKRALEQFGALRVIERLMPDLSITRKIIKFSILLLAIALIILAITGPRSGAKLADMKREGIEIMICLDVSNSMLTDDIQPNRLEAAKRKIYQLIDKLENDKVGLIVFAGDAYTQIPITTDLSAAKMFLETVKPGMVDKQGTAIGSAISLAMKSFSSNLGVGKAMIVITDGENHEDDPVAMASKAAEKGIVIYTMGLGSPEGKPVPVILPNGQRDYKTDKDGNIVVSKLDEKTLQTIASVSNGVYVRANNSQASLSIITDAMSKLKKQKVEATVYTEYEEQFQYPVGIALFLLMLEFLILERKNKYLRNIRLWN